MKCGIPGKGKGGSPFRLSRASFAQERVKKKRERAAGEGPATGDGSGEKGAQKVDDLQK